MGWLTPDASLQASHRFFTNEKKPFAITPISQSNSLATAAASRSFDLDGMTVMIDMDGPAAPELNHALNIDVAVSSNFRGDVDALKIYFLANRTKPLVSTGLEKLAATFIAMPQLEHVSLHMNKCSEQFAELDS
jgi:hypothetical protein